MISYSEMGVCLTAQLPIGQFCITLSHMTIVILNDLIGLNRSHDLIYLPDMFQLYCLHQVVFFMQISLFLITFYNFTGYVCPIFHNIGIAGCE